MGGCTPIPKKLNPASNKMADAKLAAEMTMIGLMMLGIICFIMILAFLKPKALPASTNVVSLTENTKTISIEDEMHLHYKDDEVAIKFLELMRKQKSRYVYPQCHRLRLH